MDPATRALLNSIGVVAIGSILSFIAAWFWFTKAARVKKKEQEKQAILDEAKKIASERTAEAARLAAQHQTLIDRVFDLEKQLVAVHQVVQPISTAFQAILIKELTHYHTPVMDELLEKIGPPNRLTPEEEEKLFVLLKERTADLDGRIDEAERDAAVMLPMVMKRAKTEAHELKNAPVDLKIVAVKPAGEESGEAKPPPTGEKPTLDDLT